MSENDDNITTVNLWDDVNKWRVEECGNFSDIVNRLVRSYIQGGERKDAIQEFRKQEIEGDIKSLTAQLNAKREMLEELKDQDDPKTQAYWDRLEQNKMLSADPENSKIQSIAEEFNKDAVEVAEDLADEYGKEVKQNDEYTY